MVSSVDGELSYKFGKAGRQLSSNLRKFIKHNLAEEPFFCSFLNLSSDSSNQQSLKNFGVFGVLNLLKFSFEPKHMSRESS